MEENKLPEFEFGMEEVIPGQEEQETPKEEIEQVEESSEEPKQDTKEPVIEQGNPFEVETEEETENSEDSEYLKSLYSFYKDKGLLNHEGDFNGTAEEFENILQENIASYYNQVEQELIDAVPDEGKSVMEYILSEGDGFSVDKLNEFLSNRDTVVPTEFNEDSARSFLINHYTDKLGNKANAERFVDTLEDDGKLVDSAKDITEQLKQQQSEIEKQKIEQAKKNKELRKQKQQEFQQTVAEQLKGTEWDDSIRKRVFNEVFSGNLRAKTQAIVQHPKALIQFANYMQYYDPEKGEIDEQAFANSTFSKAAAKVKNSIERHFRKSDAHRSGKSSTKTRSDKNAKFEFVD